MDDSPLNEVQSRILTGYAKGYPSRIIIQRLDLNWSSFRREVNDARRKLKAVNMTHASAIAISKGYISIYGTKRRSD